MGYILFFVILFLWHRDWKRYAHLNHETTCDFFQFIVEYKENGFDEEIIDLLEDGIWDNWIQVNRLESVSPDSIEKVLSNSCIPESMYERKMFNYRIVLAVHHGCGGYISEIMLMKKIAFGRCVLLERRTYPPPSDSDGDSESSPNPPRLTSVRK